MRIHVYPNPLHQENVKVDIPSNSCHGKRGNLASRYLKKENFPIKSWVRYPVTFEEDENMFHNS